MRQGTPLLLPSPKKLNTLIARSDERLKVFRDRRNEAIRESLGRFHTKDDGVARVMNLMQRGMTVLIAQLAAQGPLHDLRTRRSALRVQTLKHQLRLDRLAEETNRVQLSRMCIVDALMGNKAIVRSGQRAGGEVVAIDGRLYNKGQPYHRRIDLDDYIFDPAARSREEAWCEGDRYRLKRQDALDSGLFDPDWINEIPSIADGRFTNDGDPVEDLSGKRTSEDYEHTDLIELVDLIIYDSNRPLKVTMSPRGEVDEYLRIEDYEGPEGGPYSHLEYYPIPNQPMGLALASIWREQNDALRGVTAKWIEQVGMSKKVAAYQKSREKDANTLREASHGQFVALDGPPEEVTVYDFGMVSPELQPVIGALMNFWSVQSGSLDSLGGTSGKGNTATEFQGLMANANQMLEDFLRTQETFEAELSRHDLWFLTHDPLINESLIARMPGTEEFEVKYTAEQREGDFADFNVRIKPRSMMRVDSAIRARRVIESMNTIGTLAPMSTVMGGPIDLQAVARVLGRELDIDEMDELVPDPVGQMMTEQIYGGVPFEGQGMVAGRGPRGGRPMAGAMPGMPPGQAPGMAGGMGVGGKATTPMGETRGALAQRGAA